MQYVLLETLPALFSSLIYCFKYLTNPAEFVLCSHCEALLILIIKHMKLALFVWQIPHNISKITQCKPSCAKWYVSSKKLPYVTF